MDSLMLRDEAAKERIRLAEEFLDPRKPFCYLSTTGKGGVMHELELID